MLAEGILAVRRDDRVAAELLRETRIARRHASVSFCAWVFSRTGPRRRTIVETRRRAEKLGHLPGLDGDADAHLAENDRARLPGVDEVREHDRWRTKLLHCDRTESPSRLDRFFQNPTSFLNAKNANHECASDTANVAAIHRQFVPVNTSFRSSRSLSVIRERRPRRPATASSSVDEVTTRRRAARRARDHRVRRSESSASNRTRAASRSASAVDQAAAR